MGTDLIVRSNHRICFADKAPQVILGDLLAKLNAVEYRGLESFFATYIAKENTRGNKILYKARLEDETYSFEKDRYFEIESHQFDSFPHIDIDQDQCNFFVPFRYQTWCTGESLPPHDWRQQWRTYLWLSISALGGDRALYLADNSHPLERFDDSAPLADIEAALFEAFGPPAASLQQAWANTPTRQSIYMIDHFMDIRQLK